MEVILLEKIRKLGNLGDKVNVKPGYARNFLIPEQKAVMATDKNLAEFETRRADLEAKAKQLLAAANARAESLENLVIEIPAIVGDEGKLFGSVGTREIAIAIKNAGVEIEKREVLLPNGVIRFSGEFEIQVQLHSDVIKTVKINIVPEH